MSRIDEALRRAAEKFSQDAAAPASPDPTTGADVASLADEAFPIELAERRRARVSPDSAAPPLDSLPLAPSAEPPAPEKERSSIFDHIDARYAEKVVADEHMSTISREQYRRLAAVLHDARANTGQRVIMIASAVPGEGKTLTATNLSLTLSESYRNTVLLIDADLRKPTLHQLFQLEAATGLIEGLEGKTDNKLVLRQVTSHLSVLPAGHPTNDPMAALISERMRRLIAEAKERFDWIILDTPPLMMLPDAHLLSSLVDGAVLVIRADSTPHDQVKRSTDIIGRDRIFGVVLNCAHVREQSGYGYGYGNGYDGRRHDLVKTEDKGQP